MDEPKPRTTSIWRSQTIPELFYEAIKKQHPEETLVIAFHYKGTRFDLQEIVEIEPEFGDGGFREVPGQPLMGIIDSIEPESEGGDQKLVVRLKDCESSEEGIFAVTEIRKERPQTE